MHFRLEQRQAMILRQDGQYGASVLPNVTAMLESGEYDDVLRLVRNLDVTGVDTEWRCMTDWFLCLVLPSEREACMLFYKDEGPRLNEIHDASVLVKLDSYLGHALTLFQAGIELRDAMPATTLVSGFRLGPV